MSTDPKSSTSENTAASAKGYQVLQLVASTVRLPKSTAAALRLACRATKLAVDHVTNELFLPLSALKELRVVDNPLTAGLTSLRFYASDKDSRSFPVFSKAVMMAIRNRKCLEVLDLSPGTIYTGSELDAALRTLGTREWPSLRSLTISAVPTAIEHMFSMVPALTELRMRGGLEPPDVAALSRAHELTSHLEVLEMMDLDYYTFDLEEYYDSFKSLFEATTRLRRLELNVGEECEDLSYLAADLPVLEFLKLERVVYANLYPLTSILRPNLRTLILSGDVDPAPVLSSGALPALKHLIFDHLYYDGWEVLQDMDLITLKTLVFHHCNLKVGNVADLAVGLNNVPCLETLVLTSSEHYICDREAYAMSLLLETVKSLPNLRHLETGGKWYDYDVSLEVLIEYAYKVPQLEELATKGSITADAFAALAEAGHQGRWPRLRYFQVMVVDDDEGVPVGEAAKELCLSEVRAAWPGLEIEVTGKDEDSCWIRLDLGGLGKNVAIELHS